MHRRLMFSAVLQSATLITLSHICVEQVSRKGFWDSLTQDPVYQEYSAARRAHPGLLGGETLDSESSSLVPVADKTGKGVASIRPSIDTTNSLDQDNGSSGSEAQPEVDSIAGVGNNTPKTEPADQTWQAFTLGCLRAFLRNILLGPLLYWWHIWLERLFPGRPSAHHRNQSNKQATDTGDTREEEVIRKWLHQGKIQRASLSWRNTFAKWIIHWTIGRYWINHLDIIIHAILRLESPWKSIPDLRTYFFYWIIQRLLVIPFGTVLCFVLIPAPKRLPFLSGVVLISSAFILAVVRLLIPWLIQTGPVQRGLSNMTIELQNGVHAADEL